MARNLSADRRTPGSGTVGCPVSRACAGSPARSAAGGDHAPPTSRGRSHGRGWRQLGRRCGRVHGSASTARSTKPRGCSTPSWSSGQLTPRHQPGSMRRSGAPLSRGVCRTRMYVSFRSFWMRPAPTAAPAAQVGLIDRRRCRSSHPGVGGGRKSQADGNRTMRDAIKESPNVTQYFWPSVVRAVHAAGQVPRAGASRSLCSRVMLGRGEWRTAASMPVGNCVTPIVKILSRNYVLLTFADGGLGRCADVESPLTSAASPTPSPARAPEAAHRWNGHGRAGRERADAVRSEAGSSGNPRTAAVHPR